MSRKPGVNHRTLSIFALAGGLAVTAAVLAAQKPAGPPPEVPPPESPPIAEAQCRADQAARGSAQVETSFGTAHAALSAGSVVRGGDGQLYMSFEISAHDAVGVARPPLNLAIVVDHSGSMSGDKMRKAREAARGLVSRLGEGDRVALIQYDDMAEVLVPSTVVDEAGRSRLYAAIDSIQDAGGTNLGDGLFLGRDEVMKVLRPGSVNRVILLSDGNANVGVTDIPTLSRAAGGAAEKGLRITTVGLGVDYNEDLMEALAEHGRGQYYFVGDAEGLEQVFAGELKALQATVATRAELRLEPACAGVTIAEVFGHEMRREGDAVIVPLADLSGGDRRKVVVRLEVPVGETGRTGVIRGVLGFATPAGETRTADLGWLGVEVTDDVARAEASVDKAVQAKVEQVEGARAMREAAQSYERGDKDRAMGLIQAQRRKSEERAKKFGIAPAEMAPVMDEMNQLEADVAATPAGAAPMPAVTKSGKASARKLAK